MSIQEQQMIDNLDVKLGTLKRKFEDGDCVTELVEIFEDYKANGTTPTELKLLWEDVHNYLEQ